MQHNPERFSEYCEKNLDLQNIKVEYSYQSISVCLIDCIYSLRTRYNEVTKKVVQRYADKYMQGDFNRQGDTITMLLERIQKMGEEKFAASVMENNQRSAGTDDLKVHTLRTLAEYLKCLHIDTMNEFQTFANKDLLEVVIRGVKGIGDAGTNYLFMLTGDENRCKLDTHIRTCMNQVCKKEMTDLQYQKLVKDTVDILKEKHPDLTVRKLDMAIWKKFSNKKDMCECRDVSAKGERV